MKAISFLGKGEYREVTYFWQDRTCVTDLFPEAVARLFEPEKLFVLVTPQVKLHRNFDRLSERLGEMVHFVDIPEGKTEKELWEIFDRCVAVVGDGDEVLLDITHAFRSLPLVVFAVAAYLRRVKEVSIRHIIYGAFDPEDKSGRAPILDLTLLLELLDWLSGAELFLWRGDGTFLAEKMAKVHQSLWREQREDELPRKLKSLAMGLSDFSCSLAFAHPRDVMVHACKVQKLLDAVTPEVERWAKPFGVILDQVKGIVGSFACDEPERLDAQNLTKQLALIEYLLEKDLTLQAVLLAREWVVSYVILERGYGDWLDRSVRLEVEDVLGAAKAESQGENVELPEWFRALPKSEEVAQVWNSLANLRNDLAHCGMHRKAQEARSLKSRARELPERLRALLEGISTSCLYGNQVTVDLRSLYGSTAKLEDLPQYVARVQELVGEGKEVVLTGQAPVWLYLAVAHALHGKARRLLYRSPVTGEVVVFDHSPE